MANVSAHRTTRRRRAGDRRINRVSGRAVEMAPKVIGLDSVLEMDREDNPVDANSIKLRNREG